MFSGLGEGGCEEGVDAGVISNVRRGTGRYTGISIFCNVLARSVAATVQAGSMSQLSCHFQTPMCAGMV